MYHVFRTNKPVTIEGLTVEEVSKLVFYGNNSICSDADEVLEIMRKEQQFIPFDHCMVVFVCDSGIVIYGGQDFVDEVSELYDEDEE